MPNAFVEAKNYTKFNGHRDIRYIVIHDEEYPEGINSAEQVAHMFATTTRKASAHMVHDSNSSVQCVADNDIAYHAPPNAHSIGHEHDGYAKQTREQWLDATSKATLENSARETAQDAYQNNIPIRKIGPNELRRGEKGFCGHYDVSLAFGLSSHTDPGIDFPWDYYLPRVQFYYDQLLHPQSIIPTTSEEEPNMTTYDPISGGNWTLDESGAVFANDGAPYLGGANGDFGKTNSLTSDKGKFVGISFWKGSGLDKGGNGYVIVFRFKGSPKPSTYHFDRAKTPSKK